MRVLFANSFYAPEIGGGAELTLHRLASGLARRGHDVAAFTTGENSSVDVNDGVTVHRFPVDNDFRKLNPNLPNRLRRAIWQIKDLRSGLMATRLRAVARSFRPDIIQFHNLSGLTRSVWAVPGELGIPSVQVLHDLNLICPKSSMFKGGNSCESRCIECKVFRMGFATASNKIDAVVGVSQYILDKLLSEDYFKQSKHTVIYNAQPAPKASPTSGARPLRFGYIGALAPHKGVRWLIEQFDNSLGELVIAGSGPQDHVDELKALAAGKRITFLGYQPSTQFLPIIDVGIVPSIWNETLAGAAIECLANGRPAIASNRGGMPEIVRHGENGLLVDPDQPDTLGEAMARLAQDRLLQARLAASAQSSVARFTDVERFLDEYLDLYEDLMGQTSSQGRTKKASLRRA